MTMCNGFTNNLSTGERGARELIQGTCFCCPRTARFLLREGEALNTMCMQWDL